MLPKLVNLLPVNILKFHAAFSPLESSFTRRRWLDLRYYHAGLLDRTRRTVVVEPLALPVAGTAITLGRSIACLKSFTVLYLPAYVPPQERTKESATDALDTVQTQSSLPD
jgi:hypothetical protein